VFNFCITEAKRAAPTALEGLLHLNLFRPLRTGLTRGGEDAEAFVKRFWNHELTITRWTRKRIDDVDADERDTTAAGRACGDFRFGFLIHVGRPLGASGMVSPCAWAMKIAYRLVIRDGG
jgi:hypothetical protein